MATCIVVDCESPPEPGGPKQTLIFDLRTLGDGGRWMRDVYTPPVTVRLEEPGAGIHDQIIAHDDGSITQYGGANGDQGEPIEWLVQTPDFDGGDPRREKVFGDLFLSADPDASAAGLSVQPGLNEFSSVLPTTVVGAGVSGRTNFLIDIIMGLGQFAKNLGVRLTGSDTVAIPKVFVWEPALIPKVERTSLRATDWMDAGYVGAKFVQGLLIQCDTGGQTRQVQIEWDSGALSEVFTITDSAENQVPYSFQAPFIAHMMRIRVVDAGDWLFYGAQFRFQPVPELVSTWEVPTMTFGLVGYIDIERILLPYVSTRACTLTVTGDGVAEVYAVANSASVYQKVDILQRRNKAKAYKLRLETVDGLPGVRLFVQDIEVRSKSWGSTAPYQIIRPFGDASADPATAARI